MVHAGQQVTCEVLDFDVTRGQVQLSLKALQDDPMVTFADRVGEVMSGPVIQVPFGVFVRVAPGIAGLLHEPSAQRFAGSLGAQPFVTPSAEDDQVR